MIPFNPAPMTSCQRSIVIIGLFRTVSAINGEKKDIFPTIVYLTPPLKGFPLELGISAGVRINRMTTLPGGRKSIKIGLAVLIGYNTCV